MVYMNKYLRLVQYAISNPQMIPAMARLAIGTKGRVKTSYANADAAVCWPLVLTIRPTYRCNERCIMCDVWKIYGTSEAVVNAPRWEGELPREAFEDLITQCSSFKPHIHFSGGEPLIRKDIIALIKFAVSKNLFTSINTNGLLLERFADDLVLSGLQYIYVSLEGPREVHNKIRHANEAFDQTIRGIQALIDSRRKNGRSVPVISIRTDIMPENHRDLMDTFQVVHSLGVEEWNLFLLDFMGNQIMEHPMPGQTGDSPRQAEVHWLKKTPLKAVDAFLVHEQIHRIIKAPKRFCFTPYPQFGQKGFSLDDYFNNPVKTTAPVCHVPWVFCDIQPNGDVYGCSNIFYRTGNIVKDPFKDIWRGKLSQGLRENVKHKACQECAGCGRQRTYA